MKKTLLAFMLMGFVFAKPTFMNTERSELFCGVQDNNPEQVEHFEKGKSWFRISEKKLSLYGEDFSSVKVAQSSNKKENEEVMCVYDGQKKDRKIEDDFLTWLDTEIWVETERRESVSEETIDGVKSDTTKCP